MEFRFVDTLVKRGLLVGLCLFGAATARGSELSDQAALLGEREWVKIDDVASFAGQMRTDNINEFVWWNSASWDNASQKIAAVVCRTHDNPCAEWVYDEAANSWSRRIWDSVIGNSNPASGHAYDHNTSDYTGNRIWWKWWTRDVWEGVWSGSGYQWTNLGRPDPTDSASAIVYVPFLDNGNGGLIYMRDKIPLLYDLDDGVWLQPWNRLDNIGDAHMVLEYNAAHEFVMAAGGNDNVRNVYILENGASQWVQKGQLPSGCDLRVQKGSLVYDPGSGKLVLACWDNQNWYSYDHANDSWNSINWVNIPNFTWGDGNGGAGMVGLPHLGVVALVRGDQAPGICTNQGQGCGIYLFRLGQQTTSPQCGDGVDNDGDGFCDTAGASCTDGSTPGDNGCSSSADTDETDCGDGICEGGETSGTCTADCPTECGDGIDNDGDGFCDTAGASCTDGSTAGDAGCSSSTDADETNCGDGVCESGETPASCSADCGALATAVPGPTAFDRPTPYSIGYKIPLETIGGADSDSNLNSSVAVRYRAVGQSSWRVGHPPLLVLEETIGGAPHHEGRNFSGAIWDLTPSTTYEIEFTITDPDGLNETRAEQAGTRAEPVADPASPTQVNVSTLGELQSAINNAQPGHVINIAEGTYNAVAGAGKLIEIDGALTNGTATNPIILRCANPATTILDKGEEGWGIEVNGADYIYIENCTIQGGAGGEQLHARKDITGLVIRNNFINFNGTALWLKDHVKYDFDIVDNVFTGPNSFPDRGTSGNEGIVIHGSGHVVAHNEMYGAGDSIGTSLAREPDKMGPHRHMIWFGNLVTYTKDDCFEFDYAHANIIVHDNKCINYNSCLSAQPTFGGPFYFFRNVCWAGGDVKTLKIQDAASTYGHPAGLRIYNNLLVMPEKSFGGQVFEFTMKNNLWVGFDDGAAISNTSVKFWGTWDPPTPHEYADIDYNGYSYDGSFDYEPCSVSSLQGIRNSECGYEQNGFLLTDPIFAAPGMTPPGEYPNISQGGTTYYDIADPRLAPSCNAVDGGTVIPNVTDGYAGTAPDLGPYELGDPLFPFGRRGGGTLECNDGADNDGDGLTDLADPGCAHSGDPSEYGVADCDNGVDDDSDGLVDHPADPECLSLTDSSENATGDPTPPPPPGGIQVE